MELVGEVVLMDALRGRFMTSPNGIPVEADYSPDHLRSWANGLVRTSKFVEDAQLVVWLRSVADVMEAIQRQEMVKSDSEVRR